MIITMSALIKVRFEAGDTPPAAENKNSAGCREGCWVAGSGIVAIEPGMIAS